MARLTRSKLSEVVEAAIEARLFERDRRPLLLAGLPMDLVSSLPEKSRPRDQLISDIQELSGLRSQGEGAAPLVIWLQNAAQITTPSPARGRLVAALASLDRGGATHTPAGKRRAGFRVMMLGLGCVLAAVGLGWAAMGLGDAGRPEPPSDANSAGDVSARYQQTACGSISDRRTGLEWLVGPDEATWKQDAMVWMKGRAECGGGWHLPTAVQAKTLFDPTQSAGRGYLSPQDGRRYPARIDPLFDRIGDGAWIWIEHPDRRRRLWAFNLFIGKAVVIDPSDALLTPRVFGVREAAPAGGGQRK